MQHHFVIGRSTHPGLKRGKGPNQDSIGVAERSGGEAAYPMLILADGMGGYYGGEVASRMAVDTVKEIFSASDPDKTGLRAVLSDCIEGAHQKIGENAAADDLLSCMGSTIVLAVPTEQSVWIGNVGDSRAYLITAQGKIITSIILVCTLALVIVLGKLEELDDEEDENEEEEYGKTETDSNTDIIAKEGEWIEQ